MDGGRGEDFLTDASLVATIYAPPRAVGSWGISDVLPRGETRYYSLARWALVDALRASGVGRGDTVLVPGLICGEVLAAVHATEATPTFYPVSSALTPLSDCSDFVPAKAVLAVNYFGFPQDLAPFRRYCAQTGAVLIEDNAHGLMSRDVDGTLLGGRGDAGLFSFRKTIAVAGGAALVLSERLRSRVAPSLEPMHGVHVHFRLKQAFRRIASVIGPVGTVRTIAAVRRLTGGDAGEEDVAAAAQTETQMPLPANPPAPAVARMRAMPPQLEAERRRALYQVVGRLLAAAGANPVYSSLPDHTVPYGFPVRTSGRERVALRSYLGRHGLLLAKWPALPAAVAASAPDHYRSLWVVPFLW